MMDLGQSLKSVLQFGWSVLLFILGVNDFWSKAPRGANRSHVVVTRMHRNCLNVLYCMFSSPVGM